MRNLQDILKSIKPESANSLRIILLCILAATTFWFFNSLNEEYSSTLKHPIQFTYDRARYIEVEELPEYVNINVTGLGWNLFRNSLGIKVTPLAIPLDNPSEVKKLVATSLPGYISDQLSEFHLNYILTDTLYINIDERTNKKFQLLIDSTNISTEQNYRITSPVAFSPDSVELHGPLKILNSFSDTIIVRVPQTEIDDNYDEDIPIDIPSAHLISRNPPTVNIAFSVEEFTAFETSLPLSMRNFPADSAAYPAANNIQIRYYAKTESVNEVELHEFDISLDFEKMDPQDSTITPELISVSKIVQNVTMDTTAIKIIFNE